MKCIAWNNPIPEINNNSALFFFCRRHWIAMRRCNESSEHNSPSSSSPRYVSQYSTHTSVNDAIVNSIFSPIFSLAGLELVVKKNQKTTTTVKCMRNAFDYILPVRLALIVPAVFHCYSRYWCTQIQNIIHFFGTFNGFDDREKSTFLLFFFVQIFTHDNKLKITFDTLNNWTLLIHFSINKKKRLYDFFHNFF